MSAHAEDGVIREDLKELKTGESPNEKKTRDENKAKKVSELMETLTGGVEFTKGDIILSLGVEGVLKKIRGKMENIMQIKVETKADRNLSIMGFTKSGETELITLRRFMQNLCIVLGVTHEKAKPIYEKIKEGAEYNDLNKATLKDLDTLLTAVGRKNGNTKVVFKGESHT